MYDNKIIDMDLSRICVGFILLLMLAACSNGNSDGGDSNMILYEVSVKSTTPSYKDISGRGSFVMTEEEPGLHIDAFFTQGVVEEPWTLYLLFHYINGGGGPILRPSLVLGDSWNWVGREGWRYSSTLESLSDSISAHGNIYQNCAKVVTTITGEGMDGNNHPVPAKANAFIRGVRTMWFAPGIGLVRMDYTHQDGTTTHAELKSADLAEKSSDYFPLNVGNSWTYTWINEYS